MKKALQVFSIALCVAAALGAAAAQAPLMDAQDAAAEGLMQATPLMGAVTRPDGVQTPDAAFLLSYELPQFEGSWAEGIPSYSGEFGIIFVFCRRNSIQSNALFRNQRSILQN